MWLRLDQVYPYPPGFLQYDYPTTNESTLKIWLSMPPETFNNSWYSWILQDTSVITVIV